MRRCLFFTVPGTIAANSASPHSGFNLMLSQSAAALLLCSKSGYLAFPHGEEEIKSNWSEVESLTALVHSNYQTTMQTSWLRMMYQLLVSKETKINNNSSFRLPFPTCFPPLWRIWEELLPKFLYHQFFLASHCKIDDFLNFTSPPPPPLMLMYFLNFF
jgi:hypothetical protein